MIHEEEQENFYAFGLFERLWNWKMILGSVWRKRIWRCSCMKRETELGFYNSLIPNIKWIPVSLQTATWIWLSCSEHRKYQSTFNYGLGFVLQNIGEIHRFHLILKSLYGSVYYIYIALFRHPNTICFERKLSAQPNLIYTGLRSEELLVSLQWETTHYDEVDAKIWEKIRNEVLLYF